MEVIVCAPIIGSWMQIRFLINSPQLQTKLIDFVAASISRVLISRVSFIRFLYIQTQLSSVFFLTVKRRISRIQSWKLWNKTKHSNNSGIAAYTVGYTTQTIYWFVFLLSPICLTIFRINESFVFIDFKKLQV